MRQLLGNHNRSARQSGKFENRQHANQRWLAIFAWSAIHPYHRFVVFPWFQLVNERLATTGQVRAAVARNGRAPGCNLEWQIRPDAILGHDLFVSPFPIRIAGMYWIRLGQTLFGMPMLADFRGYCG